MLQTKIRAAVKSQNYELSFKWCEFSIFSIPEGIFNCVVGSKSSSFEAFPMIELIAHRCSITICSIKHCEGVKNNRLKVLLSRFFGGHPRPAPPSSTTKTPQTRKTTTMKKFCGRWSGLRASIHSCRGPLFGNTIFDKRPNLQCEDYLWDLILHVISPKAITGYVILKFYQSQVIEIVIVVNGKWKIVF